MTELGNMDRHMRDHFRVWWGLDQDINRKAIEENIAYLKFILENHESEYPRYLRWGELMESLGAQKHGVPSNSRSLARFLGEIGKIPV
jgi:hypothetical protein